MGKGDCLRVDPAGTFCICLLPSPFLTEMTRPFARLMSVNRDGWQAQSGNLLTLPHFRGAGEKDANRIQQQPLQIQQILGPLSCSLGLPPRPLSYRLCPQIPHSTQYLASRRWGPRKESHESVSVSDSVAVGPR